MRPINSNKNKLKTLINFNSHHFPDTLNKLQVSQQKKKCKLQNNVFSKKELLLFFKFKSHKIMVAKGIDDMGLGGFPLEILLFFELNQIFFFLNNRNSNNLLVSLRI